MNLERGFERSVRLRSLQQCRGSRRSWVRGSGSVGLHVFETPRMTQPQIVMMGLGWEDSELCRRAVTW